MKVFVFKSERRPKRNFVYVTNKTFKKEMCAFQAVGVSFLNPPIISVISNPIEVPLCRILDQFNRFGNKFSYSGPRVRDAHWSLTKIALIDFACDCPHYRTFPFCFLQYILKSLFSKQSLVVSWRFEKHDNAMPWCKCPKPVVVAGSRKYKAINVFVE